MKCPECKGKAMCIDSRDEYGFSRRRRYECSNKHRFTTIEVTEDLDQVLRLPPGSTARRWFKKKKDSWIQTGMEMARKQIREYIGII